MKVVQQLGSEPLPHRSYSPDLAPKYDHVFGPLKEALPDRRLTSYDDVKEAVQTWKLSGSCLKAVWKLSGSCLKAVQTWKLSESCL